MLLSDRYEETVWLLCTWGTFESDLSLLLLDYKQTHFSITYLLLMLEGQVKCVIAHLQRNEQSVIFIVVLF